MLSDRYVKGVLTVIALALVAIAGNLWLTELRPRAAVAETPAKYEIGVPRVYLDPSRAFGGVLNDPAERLAYYRGIIETADRETEAAVNCCSETA